MAPALLLVLSGNMLLDAVEVSMAVVAIPDIGRDLVVGPIALHWMLTAFALGFGGLVLAGRRVVARFGARPVYLAAVLGFALASLAGAMTDAYGVLVVTRIVKGACAALTAPTGLAIIAATFAAGAPRDRAVAVYSTVGASGFAVGLAVSGALTAAFGWRATFVVPAPAALVLGAAAWWLIPRGRGSRARQLAPWWRSLPDHSGPLVRSALGAVALNGSYWVFLFSATWHLQVRAGWSPWATGAALLPASMVPVVITWISPGLIARFGTARMILLGAIGPPLGYVGYALATLGASRATAMMVLAATLPIGVGFALGFAALHVQAVSSATPEQQGDTAGVYQTAVQWGGALVLGVTAVVAADGAGEIDLALSLVLATCVAVLGLGVAISGLLWTRREGAGRPSSRGAS